LIEEVLATYDNPDPKWKERKNNQFLKWGLIYYPKHCVDKTRETKCNFQLNLHGNGQ
jgi:hypothetical protein